MKNIALILAAGSGSRCGSKYPKQFIMIDNKTLLEYTIDSFENHKAIDEIYLTIPHEYTDKVNNLIVQAGYKKVVRVIEGGKTRRDSSYLGISAINENDANILVHDGARPFVSGEIITSCINALSVHDAVCTAIDSTDTIFITDDNGIIQDIPAREYVLRAQTPQCFKLKLIRKAHELAKHDKNAFVTDDCGLVKLYNLTDMYTVKGDLNNIKITYPCDLDFAKGLIYKSGDFSIS